MNFELLEPLLAFVHLIRGLPCKPIKRLRAGHGQELLRSGALSKAGAAEVL